jgi:hypothetical protein
VVTSIVSTALRVPSLTENVQWPFLSGVTVNVPEPLAGEIDAIPLHESADPAAAVVAVKLPLNPGSDAVNGAVAPVPVAVKLRFEGVSAMLAGAAVATAFAVPPGPLHPALATHNASAAIAAGSI